MDFGQRLRAGTAAHQAGDLEAAEAAYAEILAADPAQPDALHFLGLVAFERGEEARALELIERSIAAAPENASAHTNLGNVLKEAGRREDAMRAYMAAIRSDPGHVDAWNNIGVLLREARNLEKAAAMFRQVVAAAPGHAEGWHNLGVTEMMRGRLAEAASAFETGLDLGERRWSDPVWNAGVLCALGRRERAAALLEDYLLRYPSDPVALHQLAAVRDEAPARASDDYVRQHFDGFAGCFDEVLSWLDYRAPALVAEAVARRVGDRGPLRQVVDLGCGTGLCGPLIRQHCRRLVGVDLSPGMLRKAARRGVYDELVESELVVFLDRAPAAFDLAVAADVLIYFGSLETVMATLGRALRSGGAMIATVERLLEEDGPGYRIEPSGRFAHRASHLRAAAEVAGLVLASAESVVLRKELDREVPGLLFTVVKPPA
jgi:predicted TPR repeat methyltransferase